MKKGWITSLNLRLNEFIFWLIKYKVPLMYNCPLYCVWGVAINSTNVGGTPTAKTLSDLLNLIKKQHDKKTQQKNDIFKHCLSTSIDWVTDLPRLCNAIQWLDWVSIKRNKQTCDEKTICQLWVNLTPGIQGELTQQTKGLPHVKHVLTHNKLAHPPTCMHLHTNKKVYTHEHTHILTDTHTH